MQILSVPNIISLSRVAATAVVATFILKNHIFYAAITFAITCWTDWADGYFARKLDQNSSIGQYLDPIADKIFLTGAFIALSLAEFIPIWLMFLVITRDIILLIGSMYIWTKKLKIPLKPILISKINTVAQMLLVVTTLFFNQPVNLESTPTSFLDFTVLAFTYISVVTTFASGITYAWLTAIRYVQHK